MNNHNLLTLRELAKVITANGYKIGEKELFEKLRNWKYAWISGDNIKRDTIEARKLGYLDMVTSSKGFDKYDREQTRVVLVATEKGQEYILGRLLMELD